MAVNSDDIRISVDEARSRLEAGDAVALDVVQPAAWERIDGVVKGSIRIPPAAIAERLDEIPRDLDTIAYCT